MGSFDMATLLLVSCVCCGSIITAVCLLILIFRGKEDESAKTFRATALAPVKPAPAVKTADLAPKQTLVQILQFSIQNKADKTQQRIQSTQIKSFAYTTFVGATNALPAPQRGTALKTLQDMSDADFRTALFKYAARTSSDQKFVTLKFICTFASKIKRDGDVSPLVKLVTATLPADVKFTNKDITDAMGGLSEESQSIAASHLRKTVLAPLATAFADAKWKLEFPVEAPVKFQCPSQYGYYPCSDSRFQKDLNPGVTAVLANVFAVPDMSSKLCCKAANIIGDERPDVIKSVKENQLVASIVLIAVEILAAMLIWIPGAGLAANVALGVGIDVALSPVHGAARAAMDDQPMSKCQNHKESNWPDNAVVQTYIQKDAKTKVMQLNRTDNGCPILWGGMDKVEWNHQVGLALKQIAQSSSATGQKMPGESKIKMYPFAKFVPGYKGYPPISCIQKCEADADGSCKCGDCKSYDETNQCTRCNAVKGTGEWICGQFWENPDLVGGGWNNGYGTKAVTGAYNKVDRNTLQAG